MVTPTNGTVLLRNPNNKKTSSLNIYISDVVGAAVTISRTGLAVAGSPADYILQTPAWVEDISITTGPTVSVGMVILVNGAQTGQVISYKNFLDTLANRPDNVHYLDAGARLAFQQV